MNCGRFSEAADPDFGEDVAVGNVRDVRREQVAEVRRRMRLSRLVSGLTASHASVRAGKLDEDVDVVVMLSNRRRFNRSVRCAPIYRFEWLRGTGSALDAASERTMPLRGDVGSACVALVAEAIEQPGAGHGGDGQVTPLRFCL